MRKGGGMKTIHFYNSYYPVYLLQLLLTCICYTKTYFEERTRLIRYIYMLIYMYILFPTR